MSNQPGQPPVSSSPSLLRRGWPTPTSALAIGAHPDDVEFGAGGTLARWSAEGCVVHHVVCTDGSKGSWDPEQDRSELVVLRRAEQRRAARSLGATGQVVFLDWPDGELESGLRQRWQVAYWIRRLRPAVVLGHDPWRRYRLHPDHRHAGLLACDAVVAARDPLFFPEQDLPHHRPDALLLFEADQPDLAIDVSGFVEAKLAGLMAHTSQHRSTMGIEEGDDGSAERAFRARVTERLGEHGLLAAMGAAELFKLIDDL